jgi:hypothetical protein
MRHRVPAPALALYLPLPAAYPTPAADREAETERGSAVQLAADENLSTLVSPDDA